jgi:hypothetical protein
MRKSSVLFVLLLIVSPIIFMGCPNGLEPFLPLQNQEVRMTVSDFGSWDSKDATGIVNGSNYQIRAPYKGDSGQDTIVLTLVIPIQAATPYTIDVPSSSSALIEYCVQPISGTCTDFTTHKGVGSGSITVSSATSAGSATILEGTFSGTVVSPSGSSKSISSGEFKVTLQ